MNNSTAIDSKESTIIQELLKESTITDLFENICFANIKNVKIIETYECNSEHTGIIVEVDNKITDKTESVIIDAVVGNPVTNQIYETLYKKGSNCDKRIIIYTEGSAGLDTYNRGDAIVIQNLVENLNGFGTNIFLVKMKYDSAENRFKYSVTAKPFKFLHHRISDLPSEEELKIEEFWEFYYMLHAKNFIDPSETFTGPIDGKSEIGDVYESDKAAVYSTWTREGLFFHAKDLNDDVDCSEDGWENRMHKLQLLFPDAEITTFMDPKFFADMVIKIWQIPVQYLVDASVSEKKRMASEILEQYRNLIEFLERP
jgi:hypothetical protein